MRKSVKLAVGLVITLSVLAALVALGSYVMLTFTALGPAVTVGWGG